MNSRPSQRNKNADTMRAKLMTPPDNKLRDQNVINLTSEEEKGTESPSNVAVNPDLFSGYSIEDDDVMLNMPILTPDCLGNYPYPIPTDETVWNTIFMKKLNETIQVIKKNKIDFVDAPETYRKKFLNKYEHKGKKKVASNFMAIRRQ